MKIMFENEKGKTVSVSVEDNEATMLWDMMDTLEDRKYFLGQTWPADRRYKPEKVVFLVEKPEDKRSRESVNEARAKKKEAYEKEWLKLKEADEARSLREFRQQNASRRGMSVESENLTRAEVEKRAKGN